jgi:hypothetical protein
MHAHICLCFYVAVCAYISTFMVDVLVFYDNFENLKIFLLLLKFSSAEYHIGSSIVLLLLQL